MRWLPCMRRKVWDEMQALSGETAGAESAQRVGAAWAGRQPARALRRSPKARCDHITAAANDGAK
uniref:Uncharacterized protein n=1 Tax=Caldilinea aerophila TaxID=133453 RepID=A0A7C1JDM2_9CHLR